MTRVAAIRRQKDVIGDHARRMRCDARWQRSFLIMALDRFPDFKKPFFSCTYCDWVWPAQSNFIVRMPSP